MLRVFTLNPSCEGRGVSFFIVKTLSACKIFFFATLKNCNLIFDSFQYQN
jgi:hypothetical protein